MRCRGRDGWQRWQRRRGGRPGPSNDATRSVYCRLVRSTNVTKKKKNEQGEPEGVTDASASQAANDIVLFGDEANGTGLGEIIHASTPATVLALNGSSGTAIRSLELDQWGGIHG